MQLLKVPTRWQCGYAALTQPHIMAHDCVHLSSSEGQRRPWHTRATEPESSSVLQPSDGLDVEGGSQLPNDG